MTREAYWALLHPPRVSARERRTLLRLRGFLVVWVILVTGVLWPPALLLLPLVPRYLRAYGRRLARPGGVVARAAREAERLCSAAHL